MHLVISAHTAGGFSGEFVEFNGRVHTWSMRDREDGNFDLFLRAVRQSDEFDWPPVAKVDVENPEQR